MEMQLSYLKLKSMARDLELYADRNELLPQDTYMRVLGGINESFIICDRKWDEAERLGEPHPRV